MAAIVSGCLLAVSLIALPLRRHRFPELLGAFCGQAGLIVGLFTLWQIVRILAIKKVAGGIDNGLWIYHHELDLHLPNEVTIENWFLGHPWLMRRANTFYAYVHFPAMSLFLVWLFLRHRRDYPRVRDTIVMVTGSCLLIQMLVPVAPPRMLGGTGFTDEAVVLGQSVYGAFGQGIAAQLSAMPSVHVGWAALIAYEVIRISPSRWRWWIIAHPVITTLVVVATANHYWADGIVAVALLALADLIAWRLDRFRGHIRDRRAQPDAAARPTPVQSGSGRAQPAGLERGGANANAAGKIGIGVDMAKGEA
ncbi:MAG: phosphatase PAP2 family protein [Frankia sp.]